MTYSTVQWSPGTLLDFSSFSFWSLEICSALFLNSRMWIVLYQSFLVGNMTSVPMCFWKDIWKWANHLGNYHLQVMQADVMLVMAILCICTVRACFIRKYQTKYFWDWWRRQYNLIPFKYLSALCWYSVHIADNFAFTLYQQTATLAEKYHQNSVYVEKKDEFWIEILSDGH